MKSIENEPENVKTTNHTTQNDEGQNMEVSDAN